MTRIRFKEGDVKILDQLNKVSKEVYHIEAQMASVNGNVQVTNKKTGEVISINQRRILPKDLEGTLSVKFHKKSHATCPHCNKTFVLNWFGGDSEPMTTQAPEHKEKKTEKTEFDLGKLKELKKCQLWSKATKFNHESLSTESHVLVFVDKEKPRKLCFNTYGGTLGKGRSSLPVNEFIKDQDVEGGKSPRPWHYIQNLDKELEKLAKKGYEKKE